ncbi:purine-nucleoside phosphorylase [candidate division KSB1 bacterium]|nr:MAG: purine-nucleoside phosphorylase [candidate division KSB1 bacterium]
MKIIEKIKDAAGFLQKSIGADKVEAGVILGSGLGSFAEQIQEVFSVPTDKIPHWPKSTVKGHKGRVVLGRLSGSFIAIVQGRVHFYEGYSLKDVVFGIRVLKYLGMKSLVITNAAGSTNPDILPGSIMIIKDHINLIGSDPLIGENIDELGPRFPDMSEAFCMEYRDAAKKAAENLSIKVYEGVLAATHGPSYETPAEVKALRLLGADAVCMSTVPEVIAANHMGVKVLGLSCITNMASGLGESNLTHEDVENTAKSISYDLNRLLKSVLIDITGDKQVISRREMQ